jgi:hypothetical protein
MDFSAAASKVGGMMGSAYDATQEVANCEDLGQMTELALNAQMKMTMAKTANDMLSKSINNSKECMQACTQSM